jgi:golgi-specific brefeldin A-resistance guanine nucleotide exchange factor 1
MTSESHVVVSRVLSSLVSLLVRPPTSRNNTDHMINVGVHLLTVAFEVGADHLAQCPSLLDIVKDSLCCHLISVSRVARVT